MVYFFLLYCLSIHSILFCLFLIQILKYRSFFFFILKLNWANIILLSKCFAYWMLTEHQRQRICKGMKWILNGVSSFYWQFVTVNDIIDEQFFFLPSSPSFFFLFVGCVCCRFESIQMKRIRQPTNCGIKLWCSTLDPARQTIFTFWIATGQANEWVSEWKKKPPKQLGKTEMWTHSILQRAIPVTKIMPNYNYA